MKIIIFLLTITIIGLIVWDSTFRKDKEPLSSISYEYTTDTVFIDKPYAVPEPYAVSTPPRILIRYKMDSSLLDSLKLVISDRNIIITGLQDSITISKNYLKQFPENPKLIALQLKRDTLSLGLLGIDGLVNESIWPIDLNIYEYRWDYLSDLSRHGIKPPPTETPSLDYYVGGGYDFVGGSPYISGKISKDWSRIRLYGITRFGLLNNESHSISLGVDYIIYGKNPHRIR